MRVSEYFKLGKQQGELDFVDVDTVGDTRVFIDPSALTRIPTDWGEECVSLVQHFFHTVLGAIRDGNDVQARRLLGALSEPNETHLGFSRGASRGHGLGAGLARKLWEQLSKSAAVGSGLLEDLEDTILMVELISDDLVSDITTNLIRYPLIRYTQSVCREFGIPLEEVDSGWLWQPHEKRWLSRYEQLPMADGRKLLLVPKVIVRKHLTYNADEYYRDYVLGFMRGVHLDANDALVHTLKSGDKRVFTKALKKRYGSGKAVAVRLTVEHPEILDNYRSEKRKRIRPPLDGPALADIVGVDAPDYATLLNRVVSTPPGKKDAGTYHGAIYDLFNALLYPDLSNPRKEQPIHGGRKRIDIVYSNCAESGFFQWVAARLAATYVFVECKNFTGDVANPELDQLSGRFSPQRGTFGILTCRDFSNKNLFLKRCRDTAQDGRGHIVVLDDDDLRQMVALRAEGDWTEVLRERIDQILL